MTMNDTWGYKKDDHNWKSTSDILHNLSDISSKGGNFLLNVGPTADGRIPQESIDRLKAVGLWMKTNSEAIHATEASPFARRLPWGRVTRKTTAAGTTLYLHVWDWPADGKILLPTLRETPQDGWILASGEKVRSGTTPAGLEVSLPGKATDPIISVVKLEFNSPLTVTQEPFVAPAADGNIHLEPVSADLHGGYTGTIRMLGSGASARLTGWNDPAWSIEYVIQSPQAATWLVEAEVSATASVKLSLEAGGKKIPATIPANGSNQEFTTVPLGTLELPAGQQSIHLKGVPDGWKPIELRKLTLRPAK